MTTSTHYVERHPAAPAADASPMELVALLLRQRRTIVGTILVAAAVAVVSVLLTRRQYTSAGSFFAQSRRLPSNLSGIAAQFGVNLPQGEPGQSPQFYISLLTSRPILTGLVDAPFRVGTAPPQPLWQHLRVKPAAPEVRRDRAVEALRRNVSATTDAKTGVISFAVRAPDPGLAQAVADSLLGRVSEYNLRYRRSQAVAERRFSERRMNEVAAELRSAEDRLQSFFQGNRDYRNSPILTFQAERLQRDVDLRRQIYGSLAQSVEQAKIEEVRDTPVISVVETPHHPIKPDSRGGAARLLLALIAGTALGTVIGLVRELASRVDGRSAAPRRSPNEEMREAWHDLRHPWRLLPGFGGRRAR